MVHGLEPLGGHCEIWAKGPSITRGKGSYLRAASFSNFIFHVIQSSRVVDAAPPHHASRAKSYPRAFTFSILFFIILIMLYIFFSPAPRRKQEELRILIINIINWLKRNRDYYIITVFLKIKIKFILSLSVCVL